MEMLNNSHKLAVSNMTLCSLLVATLAACGGGSAGGGTAPDATVASADVPAQTAAGALGAQASALSMSQRIATEGQGFTVTGTQTVRYGVGTRWIQKKITGNGQCTNGFFGADPARGTVKSCELLTVAATLTPPPKGSSPAPTPTPTPAPAPTAAAPASPSQPVLPITNPPTAGPSVAPQPTASGTMVSGWVRVAMEGAAFNTPSPQNVRYGDGARWITKQVSGNASCSNAYFGSDPAYGSGKFCEVQLTVPGVVQTGPMAVVNLAFLPKPGDAFNGPRARQLSAADLSLASNQPAPSDIGSFREPCNFSHMGFDDPIVFPGKPGASHLHTFFGNSNTDASSTGDSLAGSGDSTCMGGTLNRTAYWMPSLIDTRTGQPLAPTGALFYYKRGYLGVKGADIQPFPKGLRMIAGDSKNTGPIGGFATRLECSSGVGGHYSQLPSCPVGDSLVLVVVFPQCWDGINLDSPDHKSHMSYATGGGCPSTHPVPLAEITMNVGYKVTEPDSGTFWRLSSDSTALPGGYSLHADWFGGWDGATNKTFTTECINKSMDCHAYLLGDGRILY